jgi:hypothetical protein
MLYIEQGLRWLHNFFNGNRACIVMPADSRNEIELTAERLYAARSAMAETGRSARKLGVAEIMQFLADPERSLSMAEQRSLFADPQVRADYRRLKSQIAVAELPALAAASTGDVSSRRFDGGMVSLHPSRVQGQVYVVLRFSWPTPPRTMLLEDAKGDLVKRALPPADQNGELIMVLDESKASDARFLRMISDPTATGSFLL